MCFIFEKVFIHFITQYFTLIHVYAFICFRIFQLRNEQIQKASLALEQREITPLQFLDQVIFKAGEKDIRAQFENLSSCEDYFPDDESGDDADIAFNLPRGSADPNDALLCKVCYSRNINCLFLPCRHACCCSTCYQSWKITDTRQNEYEGLYTEDETETLLSNEPIQPPTCPLCRTSIDNVVEDIVI